MSVEKFFALYFPLETKSICTVKIAKRVTIVAAVFLAVYESQFFFIVRKHEDNYCELIRVSEDYTLTLNRIDAILYSFGPFTIISIFNLVITYKFVKAKLESAHADTTESTNQALSKSAMRGTGILITVSFTFILLTDPGAMIYSIIPDPDPIVDAVVYNLTCMNHSTNAVLYCIVGSRFRQEVINTLFCGREKNRQNNINSNTNPGRLFI